MPARIRFGMAAAALRRREEALWFLLGLGLVVTGRDQHHSRLRPQRPARCGTGVV